MTRRTRLIAASGLLFFLVVVYYRWNSGEIPNYGDDVSTGGGGRFQANTTGSGEPPRLCDGDDCFTGSWKPRQPRYKSVDELKPWQGCPSAVKGTQDKKAAGKRLVDVMNWVWRPDDGSVLSPWHSEAFVTRLLKSPGGLIVVGDEISRDYAEALVVLLNRNKDFTLKPIASKEKLVRQYTLEPRDSTVKKRLGVPDSRFKTPIVTVIQDSLLINDADLLMISSRLGTKGTQKWTTPLPRIAKWPSIVEQLAGGPGDADTILVLNTGIHWSRKDLTLLKPRGNSLAEQNYLTEAYRQMLRVVSEQLRPISHLSVYYRSTTPGHPKCATRTSPYNSARAADAMEKDVVGRLLHGVATEQERDEVQKRDWDLFAAHNDLWRRAIVRLEKERTVALARPYPYTKVFAKWQFMDTWSQALQRPDAHHDPLQDCVSWCSPVLFDQWTKHLNHMLFLEQNITDSPPGSDSKQDPPPI